LLWLSVYTRKAQQNGQARYEPYAARRSRGRGSVAGH
jgi:hypothetical protein